MKNTTKFQAGKFIFSLIFNAVVLTAALIFFHPFFEEIDDTQLCMIAEGAFGNRDWHLIYENVILGKLYVLLGSLFPLIRWHVILQYAFIFVAYVFACYVISKHKRGLFISIVAVLASFYEMYISIQYTKTAAFTCMVGFILIFEAVRNKTVTINQNDSFISKDSKRKNGEAGLFIVVAFILVLYGSLLRPEAFFIAAVPTLAVGLLELARTRNIKKYLLFFIPMFAMVMLFRFVDSYVYSVDADWSAFMKLNRSRMELNDYRYDILDFTKYADELKALDVSENDALAILTYQYGDDSVFSYSRFKEIRDAFGRKEFGYKTFANLFENLISEMKRSYLMLIGLSGLILVLIASIITDRSKSSPGAIRDAIRKLISMLGIAVSCALAIVYFQYSGRYSHRLMGAIVIPTMFLICFMIDSTYIKENDSKIIFGGNKNDITMAAGTALSILLIGLSGLMYMENTGNYTEWISGNESILSEMDKFADNKEVLYVGDTFTFQNAHNFEVFKVFEQGSLDNFVTCGSWYLNSPITKPLTKKYGYENPFDAIRSGNDNVLLLDNNGVECKTLFLNEHYDKVYEAEKIDNFSGIDVYRMTDISELGESEN